METCKCCENKKNMFLKTILALGETRSELPFVNDWDGQFVEILNAVITMPFFRNIVMRHECRLDCFICFAKNVLVRKQKIKFADIAQKYFAGYQELKGLKECCLFVLEKFAIRQQLVLRVDYDCGKHFGICLNGTILLAYDFVSSMDMFFTEYYKLQTFKALDRNSVLIKKANSVFECMKTKFITNSNEINFESLQNCCVNPKISFESNAPINFFYLEIDWQDIKKNILSKILQVLVGLPGSIELGNNTLHLHCILVEQNKEWINVWRTSNGFWQLEGKTTKISYTWLDTIIFIAFSEYLPKFVIYESTPITKLCLSKDEIIRIEKLSSAYLSNACFHAIEHISHFTPLIKFETKCYYCQNSKLEGEKCYICKFNEGSWVCDNHHENIYVSFNCDVCNVSRCFIQNYQFKCSKCNAVTPNQLYCSECPIRSCMSCERIIFPGQTVYLFINGTYSVSYKSKNDDAVCVDCSKFNNEFYE